MFQPKLATYNASNPPWRIGTDKVDTGCHDDAVAQPFIITGKQFLPTPPSPVLTTLKLAITNVLSENTTLRSPPITHIATG
jgi:hypothetical protein